MAEPIGPGDWVECRPKFYVAQPPQHVTLIGPWPKPGAIYQVREAGLMPGSAEPAIRLAGIVASYPGHPDCWWPVKHFRPIYRRRDAERFTQELTRKANMPAKTPEVAA